MIPSQRLTIESRQKSARINELIDKDQTDALTDEENVELRSLKERCIKIDKDLLPAAIAAEGVTEIETRDTGDRKEIRELRSRLTFADYGGPAAHGGVIQGAAAEFNAAMNVDPVGKEGGVNLPWEMLELETRAFTSTSADDGPEGQRPILQRLFGPGVMDTLGVRIDSVPVGRVEWPLITSGVAPAMKKEESAAGAAVTAGFSYANLKPKRLTGQYEYTHEFAASVAAGEAALRRDLTDAVRSKMQDIIINGQAPTTQNPQHIEGFIAELTQEDDTAVATADRYGKLHSEAVDGIHGGKETEVMSVIGINTYQHAAGLYIAGSGESGSELLNRRSGGCMASTYIPDPASNIQSAILHAAGPNGGSGRGDSVAAMWPALEIVRDPYSKASQGVVLTWISLWDAKVAFRAAAYKLIGIKLA